MANLLTVSTQGHYGGTTNRLLCIATQGHFGALYLSDSYRLKLSAREHLENALSAEGWSDTDKWVKLGRIQPVTRPPAVAVDCPEVHRVTYESGGENRAIRGYFDIGVLGANEAQLNDLKDDIAKNLGNMGIIDFSIAMPGDPGYDAAAQTVAHGHIRNIRGRVVDPIEFSARVSFTLETDKPI